MDSIDLNIINKLGSLDQHIKQLEEVTHQSLDKINVRLPLSEVKVSIIDKPEWVIPELGISGYATDGHHVDIYVDSQFPDFTTVIKDELPRTLAHELHHAMRWQGPGYGKMLFEALISEGLADHFDHEVWEKGPRPWDLALDAKQAAAMFALARPEYLNNFYNESDWFFGSKERGIPRWTGYTLGYIIVENYLYQHPDQTAASLVYAPAHQFIGALPSS